MEVSGDAGDRGLRFGLGWNIIELRESEQEAHANQVQRLASDKATTHSGPAQDAALPNGTTRVT